MITKRTLIGLAAYLCAGLACPAQKPQTPSPVPRTTSQAPQPAKIPAPTPADDQAQLYKNFRYLLKFEGRYAAGFSQITPLSKPAPRQKVKPGESAKLTGRTTFEKITLSRGLTHDTGFENWASSAQQKQSVLKDLSIDVMNEAGQKSLIYKLAQCAVEEYQAIPDLDSGKNAIRVQTFQIKCAEWKQE